MSVKKRPDGQYRARLRGPDGREIAKHFALERDAKAWEAEQRTKMNRGDWLDPGARRVTFREFATRWAEAQPWRYKTAERAQSTLRCHLLPAFGERPIASIRPSEVQAFVKRLSGTLSPGSVQAALRLFKSIMRAAVADRLVASSPADGVRSAPYDPRAHIPERADIDALLEVAPDRYKAMITIAAGAGLRSGEVRGLTVDRVRWLAKEIVVDRQLGRPSPGGVLFAEPKSKRSIRVVPAAGFVVDALARHVEQFGEGPQGLIFTDELHRPLGPSAFGNMWIDTQRAAGQRVRYHDLRHFCASTMLSANVPAPVVAEVMGHTIAELLRTYAHVIADDRSRARRAIEEAFADSTRTAEAI